MVRWGAVANRRCDMLVIPFSASISYDGEQYLACSAKSGPIHELRHVRMELLWRNMEIEDGKFADDCQDAIGLDHAGNRIGMAGVHGTMVMTDNHQIHIGDRF